MAQVNIPQKENKLAKPLQIGGAIAGGVMTGGSPQGVMMGAQAGGMAAGMMDQGQQSPALQAAQRRVQAPAATVQGPSPLQELEAARMEVAQLPPEQRQQFEAPILAALMQARRQEGTA